MNFIIATGRRLATMTSRHRRVIDLRSDTVSRPTEAMREAMYKAEVGDDVFGEDPTVNALEEKSAAMFGMESALFVPSGTMGNMIAMMAHCTKRGSEVITGDKSHVYLYEQGGPAQLGGIMVSTVPNKPDGTFDLSLVEKKVRGEDIHEPITSLICIENTHNVCGGKVLPMDWLEQLRQTADRLQIPVHVDGARIFNAAVYLGVEPHTLVQHFSSVSFCISKGLGAPVGAVLVGSRPFISRARRLRKVLGGGMRQAGVIAAAGLVALDQMVQRLSEDHNRAMTIARAINDFNSNNFSVDVDNLHTNIIFMKINPNNINGREFCDRLQTVTESEKGEVILKIMARDDRIRMVTYHEITDEDVAAIINKLHLVMKEFNDAAAISHITLQQP